MAYDFVVHAWQDFSGIEGEKVHWSPPNPDNLDNVHGVLVEAYDETQEGESHFFWAFTLYAYEDWEQWLDHIGLMIEMYGMELA